MSKRYREVLDQVETPMTRHVARRAAQAADEVAEEVAPRDRPGGARDDTRDDTRDGTRDDTRDGGGVATLVRPTRTTSSARGATSGATVGRRPVTTRGGRPGNGPADADEPLAFAWRGRHYEVTRILGHWREEEGWWRRPDGEPIRIEQSDLWRVEAVRGTGPGVDDAARTGVYELARRGATWRLDRVWD